MKKFGKTSTIDRTNNKTFAMLKKIEKYGAIVRQTDALAMLRAVLHTLRDQMTLEECADFSSQLPTLVRGFYFEGWEPKVHKNRAKRKIDFFEGVRKNLGNRRLRVDFEKSVAAVLKALSEQVSSGEMREVIGCLPTKTSALVDRTRQQQLTQ